MHQELIIVASDWKSIIFNQGMIFLVVYIVVLILVAFAFWYIGAKVFKIKKVIELQEEILQELKRIKPELKE